MSALKFGWVAFVIVALTVIAAPRSVQAQGLDVGTLATFDRPFAIPGHVLPAGTYAFLETGSSVVQIWDKNQSKLYATLLTNSAIQPEFAERQEFEIEPRGADRPAELKAWFYEGGSLGHEFIYRDDNAHRASD